MRSLAAELVRSLSQLRAVILQASANPDEVAVFLFEKGCFRGPTAFSTLGMRIQNEQSGSTSLFAQPLAVEPVPEKQGERQGLGNRDQGSEEQGIEGMQTGVKDSQTGQSSTEQALSRMEPSPSERELQGQHEVSERDFSRANKDAKTEGALAPATPIAPARIPRTQLESRLESVLAELSAPCRPALGHNPPGPSRSAQALVLPPRGSPRRRNLLSRCRKPLADQSHSARHRSRGGKSARLVDSDATRQE